MSALSDAVDALQARVTEDVARLQQIADEANQRALDAAANDAADAATIADLQAQVDASNAEAQQIVDRINAIDPVADFPGVPPDPGADPNPPSDGTGGDTGTPDLPPVDQPPVSGDVPVDPNATPPPGDTPVDPATGLPPQ